MARDILEPDQIATLAGREIPRIVPADGATLFSARAARLRTLAVDSPIAGYLRLMALLCDAQQDALDALSDAQLPDRQQAALAAQSPAAREAGMPPLHAASLPRDPAWRDTFRALCRRCAGTMQEPPELLARLEYLSTRPDEWLEAQADALLDVAGAPAVEADAAPFVMAALQVDWTVLALAPECEALAPMPDAPGLCPCCGSRPVASVVHAKAPYAGYRYLACGLCALQWHYVRVQCSLCGAAGKDIAYESLTQADGGVESARTAAVRAETCDSCNGYRKILYAEHDAEVEAVADDLASLPLDLLLGEQGRVRGSQNPLLWQPVAD